MDSGDQGAAMMRCEYLIDRFRVVLEQGGRWHCACVDFIASNACHHTQEAAGMRAAQVRIRSRLAAGRSQLI